MPRVPIPVDPQVRDRLRRLGAAGESYDEILTRLLDAESERVFTADLARRFRGMRDGDWVDLDLERDLP